MARRVSELCIGVEGGGEGVTAADVVDGEEVFCACTLLIAC
jgi:hypothetical protein